MHIFHLSSSIASEFYKGVPKELCSHGASGGISRFNDGRADSLCDLIAERDDIGRQTDIASSIPPDAIRHINP